mgnify:CR=1 FL=1
MNRIEKNWLKFREKVISPQASKDQLTDMRHSFYAGVMTVLSLTQEVIHELEEVSQCQTTR